MSLFFGLCNSVPFGITGYDTSESSQFGSTCNSTFIRLYTSSNATNDYVELVSGGVIGSSNISGGGVNAINNVFLGSVVTTNSVNTVQQTLAVQGRRVGINYPAGMRATLDLYSADTGASIAYISGVESTKTTVIGNTGSVGIGTVNPNPAVHLDVIGTVMGCNLLINTLSGTYGGNTINGGLVTLSNMQMVRTRQTFITGTASEVSGNLFEVRTVSPAFPQFVVKGDGTVGIGTDVTYTGAGGPAMLSIAGSTYACNLYLNSLYGLQAGNSIQAPGLMMSNAMQYHGQTLDLAWTSNAVTPFIFRAIGSNSIPTILNSKGQWGVNTLSPNTASLVDVIGGIHACNIVTTSLRGTGSSLVINSENSILSNVALFSGVQGALRYTGGLQNVAILQADTGATVAPALRVMSSGLVGIGTSNPAAQLDVNGSVYALNVRMNSFESGAAGVVNGQLTSLSNLTTVSTSNVYALGAIGIRTSAPKAGIALDVIGNVWCSNLAVNGITTAGQAAIEMNSTSLSNLNVIHGSNMILNSTVASNANVMFISAASRNLILSGDGRVAIGTSTSTNTDTSALFHVHGIARASNMITTTLENTLTSVVGFQNNTLSNIADVNTRKISLQSLATGSSVLMNINSSSNSNIFCALASGRIGIGTSNPDALSTVDIIGAMHSCNVRVASITGTLPNININFTQTSLSNVTKIFMTDDLRMNGTPILYSNATINPDVTTTGVLKGILTVDTATSNIRFGDTMVWNATQQRLGVGTSNPAYNLDVPGVSALRGGVYLSNVLPMASGAISFNGANIVQVENLVVTNSITSLLGNYSNLPANVVRLEDSTSRVASNVLPTNLVFLTASNTIDPAILPVQVGATTSIVRSADRFGIGTRTPAQRLHVNNGNVAVTGGFVGIGQTSPTSVLHITDSGTSPHTVYIEQTNANRNPMLVVGTMGTVMQLTHNGRMGLGSSPAVGEGLVVNTGMAKFNQGISTPSLFSSVNANGYSLSNIGNVNCLSNINTFTSSSRMLTSSIDVSGDLLCGNQIFTSKIVPISGTNTVECTGAVRITGAIVNGASGTAVTYLNPANLTNITTLGLSVTNSVQAAGFYATSDRRFKQHIESTIVEDDLLKCLNLNVYKYNYIDPMMGSTHGAKVHGFIAQEVKEVIPEAVTLHSGFIPNIQKVVNVIDDTTLELQKEEGMVALETGDKIKLHTDKNSHTVTLMAVIDKGDHWKLYIDIDPGTKLSEMKYVFAYGTWSNNVHAMDYDRLVCVSLNALKALYTRVEKLEEKLCKMVVR